MLYNYNCFYDPKTWFHICLGGEVEQNMSLQNIPLWYKDYFELITLRIKRCKRSLKTVVEVILL